MVFSVKSQFNVKLIDDLEAFAESFARDSVKPVAERVAREIQTPLEDELKFYPRKRPGQRYVRTFNLRNGSSARVTGDERGITIRARSTAPYDRYVRGTFNRRSRSEAVRDISRYHVDRWVPLYDILNFYEDAAETEFVDAIREQFRDDVQRVVKRRSRIR